MTSSKPSTTTAEANLDHDAVQERARHSAVVNVAQSATARDDAERLLDLETGAAWFEYLERTRGLPAPRYDELEPWAWQLLQERLRTLARRRERLRR